MQNKFHAMTGPRDSPHKGSVMGIFVAFGNVSLHELLFAIKMYTTIKPLV